MTMKVIRRSRHMTLYDDRESGCYRVTADDGFCFEQPDEHGQNGLHELVADYTFGLSKREALQDARRDFNEHTVEPCGSSSCEWCHSSEPVAEVLRR